MFSSQDQLVNKFAETAFRVALKELSQKLENHIHTYLLERLSGPWGRSEPTALYTRYSDPFELPTITERVNVENGYVLP